ncbi:MAG: hypothetical protein U5J97_05150 [Trueperaceae bacterium]|nr:hypothetical protein [Trueperaceae bacterium]
MQSGTTTELNLTDVMAALDIDYTPVIFETADQAIASYDSGQCESYTTDVSGLVSRKTTLAGPRGQPHPAADDLQGAARTVRPAR